MDAKAPATLEEQIRRRAREAGFAAIGFTPARLGATAGIRYRRFVARGEHGDMDWLAQAPARRAHPLGLWPEARTAIVLGLNYGPDDNPLDRLSQRTKGLISVYARNQDYHDLIKKRLKRIASWLADATGAEVKVFVDTAPLLEKPLAARAGLGWPGKHTNLVARRFGSWLFLGEILTTLDLAPDAPETDHCGTCRRCLDICPTDAFPAPYRLDARRCLSYLTIEHKGHIAESFRTAMGNRIYGCDDCLAVCPWNRFAEVAMEIQLQARDDLRAPPLRELADLDDAAFRSRFRGSPVKRIGRNRFLRNVLIAIGNSGDKSLADAAAARLGDPSSLVRAMAIWALGRLDPVRFGRERLRAEAKEPDPAVKAEWQQMPAPDGEVA